MKKLAAVVFIGLLMVPWPVWVDALVFRPYFNTIMTPEEASGASLLVSVVVVYVAIGLLASLVFATINTVEKTVGYEAQADQVPPTRDAATEPSEPGRRKYERERQRRKQRAQQEGALLITLAMLGDDKK